MEVISRRLFQNVPFDEYQTMPGLSHSDIKNNGVPKTFPTPKMQLGTAVHNYLLEPEKYNHENIHIVKPAAIALKKQIGEMWRHMIPETVVLCTLVHNGMALQVRYRVDLGILNRIVIDIKVSPVPLSVSIKRYGYDDQLNGYRIGFNGQLAILIRVDPTTCGKPGIEPTTETYLVPPSNQFWEYTTVKYGKPWAMQQI
jgi:hypothetical protein